MDGIEDVDTKLRGRIGSQRLKPTADAGRGLGAKELFYEEILQIPVNPCLSVTTPN